MAANSTLYGIPRPKSTAKEISSSTSLAFTSQLSSLLAANKDSQNSVRTWSGRARPNNPKSDIFTAHNKNARKRAAKDVEENAREAQTGKMQGLGEVDGALLHRSKRKMEEKARLYGAMKRGDYVPPTQEGRRNMEEDSLVDFDRKWAENEARGEGNELDTSSDDDGSDEDMVEYTDEFGRQRQGTKAEAAREERRRTTLAADEPDRFSARPAQPGNLIFGDTIQAAAFNPDEPMAARMDELARKRDRSRTPPEEVHYDARAEVRTKGVGFYSFSTDGAGRRKEMDELETERIETERGRREREERTARRKAELEERRRKIREKRGEMQAERFLQGLAADVGDSDSTRTAEQARYGHGYEQEHGHGQP